jgi:hypothetical protein
MTKRRDAGFNDPGRWASAACELPPEGWPDEELTFYRLPFDICMELAEGDKKKARALHWGRWNQLKEKEKDNAIPGSELCKSS